MVEEKRKEIHNIIDMFATKGDKNELALTGRRTTQKLYENKKEEHYWNDWFGK